MAEEGHRTEILGIWKSFPKTHQMSPAILILNPDSQVLPGSIPYPPTADPAAHCHPLSHEHTIGIPP